MSIPVEEFVVPRAIVEAHFAALGERYLDPVTGDFDTDALRGEFDDLMASAASMIQDDVLDAGGTPDDVNEGIWAFIHSIQAGLRPLQ